MSEPTVPYMVSVSAGAPAPAAAAPASSAAGLTPAADSHLLLQRLLQSGGFWTVHDQHVVLSPAEIREHLMRLLLKLDGRFLLTAFNVITRLMWLQDDATPPEDSLIWDALTTEQPFPWAVATPQAHHDIGQADNA